MGRALDSSAPGRRRERLVLALEATTDGIWDWDLRTGTLALSPRWHAMLGYAPDELGQGAAGWLAAVHPLDRAWAEAALDARRATADATFTTEYRVLAKNGEVRWLLSRGRVVERDAAGRPLRVVGTDTDVTLRKQAELALKESEARFRHTADHAPVAIWLSDATGACTYLNPRWHELTGQPPGEGEGWGWLDRVHPDERTAVHAAFTAAAAAQAPLQLDYRLRRPEGGWRWVIDTAAPRRDEDGRLLGYVGSVIDIDGRKRAEAECLRLLALARLRARQLQALADASLAVAAAPDLATMLATLAERARTIIGARVGATRRLPDSGDPAESGRTRRSSSAELAAPLVGRDGRVLGLIRLAGKADGSDFTAEDEAILVQLAQVGAAAVEKAEAEAALRASTARAELALAAGRMGTWEWDLALDRSVWDEAEHRLFGVEASGGPIPRERVLALVHAEDRPALVATVGQALQRGEPFEAEFRVRRPDGGVRWIAERGVPSRDEAGRVVRMTGVSHDITQRKLAEERIHDLALRDPLTELPNRRMMQTLLGRELARARREGRRLALLLLDLDNFKEVNDTLGHSAGDALLVAVARGLKATLREGDVVARLGGDEFAVLAPVAAAADEPAALAGRLVARLAEPFAVRELELRAGASVGIALWPDDAGDAETLLARADLALYAAKNAGRGTWRFFRPAMQERARAAAALDRDLRRALERDELTLRYQPVVEVGRLEPWAFEALLRWRRPGRGLVPPGAFLPAAERNRLIVPLSLWTLTQAIRQAARWRADGTGAVPVAVNLATSALEAEGLVEQVAARLDAEGLPAAALIVEVTEGAMADNGRAMATLAALRGLGVKVAIDDFGAGYSSLARLRDLPLDLLKLDGTFLAAPTGRGEAILRAVVALAQSLGLPTVVEGVETAEQLALVDRVGASCAQGFLLGRPMPARALPAWRQAWSQSRRHGPDLDLLRHGDQEAVLV